MELVNIFQEFITNNGLINKGETILLSVSGGPDSLTMLDLFNRIKVDYELKLIVFHLNHQFRQEAAAEAVFVKNVCDKLGIESIIESFDVPALVEEQKLSPEEAARKIRLNLICEKCQSRAIKKAAMAHNKNDQVETILFNLFRGTGLKGLTGIDPVSEIKGLQIIHPLLNVSRKQIEKYCHERNLQPRRDPTNEETIYTRNKIRHHIIPYIEKEINPGVNNVIARMAGVLRDENDYLGKVALKIKSRTIIEKTPDKYVLSLSLLKETPAVIRKRIFRQIIYDLKEKPRNLYYEHIEAVDNLVTDGNTGNMLDLADNIKVKRVYNKLIFKRGMLAEVDIDFLMKFSVPGHVKLPDDNIITAEIISIKDTNRWQALLHKKETCLCDASQVQLPLWVRTRRDGDKFYPLGMNGKKKIKDFFIDEKIPAEVRDKIPLVTDNTGKIIWVVKQRMDDRFKLVENTDKILKIIYKTIGDNDGTKI